MMTTRTHLHYITYKLTLGILIPGKSHSQVESCNYWVSIETLDFTRVCTFYRRDQSWIPAERERPRCCPRPMPGRHWSINIAGSSVPKTSQNGRGRGLQGERDREAQWSIGPRTTSRGIAVCPRRTPLDNRSTTWVDGSVKQRAAASTAFQFAIRIDPIRYANRFESIRFAKKSAFRFTIVVMQFLH